MSAIIKQLKITKKGRKYFECLSGRYKAKLVINDISKDFEIGQVVTLQVNDLTERSRYGVVVKYEPVAVIDEAEAEAMRKAEIARKEAEKWLGYAEHDVMRGFTRTNAITRALSLCAQYDHLAERLANLKDKVEANAARYEAQKQQLKQQQAKGQDEKRTQCHMRILFPDSMPPEMGQPVRHRDRVIVFESAGKPFRISESHASIWGVHLLGHEGEYGRYYYYRNATADEVSLLERQEAEAQAKADAEKKRQETILRIKNHIIEHGECPDGWHHVDGERLIDTQNNYGGGEWFVITDTHIWYVRNNGADGDNWSRNNVRTGGAGAIGYRVPYNNELAEQLRKLDR